MTLTHLAPATALLTLAAFAVVLFAPSAQPAPGCRFVDVGVYETVEVCG